MKPLEDLAREAGMVPDAHVGDWHSKGALATIRDGVDEQDLARFRSLCRAEAMEEAARLCDAVASTWLWPCDAKSTAEDCAAAIREAAKEQGNG